MDVLIAEAIIKEHLKARGITMPPPSPRPVLHPLAVRLSEVLRDPSLPERERVRLEQIVSLVLADRRRS